jgi:hypothetical protein
VIITSPTNRNGDSTHTQLYMHCRTHGSPFVMLPLLQPPTQPQSQPLQEVAFTTQMRHLSIALDEKRHLVVRTRLTPAPNAMLGIVLDPNVESSAQRSLRERLVRCLSRISMEGGAAAAALPHPVYYRCGPDQEQQLFDHITQRICAILGLSLHTLAGPAQRGKRRVGWTTIPFQWRQSGGVDRSGVVASETRASTLEVHHDAVPVLRLLLAAGVSVWVLTFQPDSHTAGSSGGAAAGDGAKKAKKCTCKLLADVIL